MRTRLIVGLAVTLGVTTLLPSATLSATGGGDREGQGGEATLAEILLSDSAKDDAEGFDRRHWDYDIVTQAALLFPDLVAAASNPDAELTVFLPNDAAFKRLVKEITGTWPNTEAETFAAVASLGTDTVLAVLQYHIVPSAISYRDAKMADGAVLPTLLDGSSLTVDVRGRWWKYVQLVDADGDDRDPFVVDPNVGGRASNGFAHGIDRVLRPIDLP